MMDKKKIMIKFHDNDFGQTMIYTMTIIQMLWEKSGVAENFTKERVAELYNITAPQVYWTTNNWEESTPENREHIRKYLFRKPEHVLLDEEVNEILRGTQEFWNGESVIYDSTIPDHNQQVYTI